MAEAMRVGPQCSPRWAGGLETGGRIPAPLPRRVSGIYSWPWATAAAPHGASAREKGDVPPPSAAHRACGRIRASRPARASARPPRRARRARPPARPHRLPNDGPRARKRAGSAWVAGRRCPAFEALRALGELCRNAQSRTCVQGKKSPSAAKTRQTPKSAATDPYANGHERTAGKKNECGQIVEPHQQR